MVFESKLVFVLFLLACCSYLLSRVIDAGARICVFSLQNIKVLDASAAKSTRTTEVSILAFLGGPLCCQVPFIFLGR